MSTFREPVEWVFGAKGTGIKAEFAALNFYVPLELAQRPVGDFFIAAAILYNALVCMYPQHNQVYRFFNGVMPVPRVEEYFAR